MNSDDILKLINALPAYIQYLYPGYCTIYLYLLFNEKPIKDNNFLIFKSLTISFIYLQILKFISILPGFHRIYLFLVNHAFLDIVKIIMLLSMAIVTAYVAYRLSKSEKTDKFLQRVHIDAEVQKNEIAYLTNYGKSAWIVVYLKNTDIVYEGSLLSYHIEDTGYKKHIVLGAYRKYTIDQNGNVVHPYLEMHQGETNQQIVIYYDDIARIEKR